MAIDKIKRGERIAALVKMLVEKPSTQFSLGALAELFGAGKSTISEDLTEVAGAFRRFALGEIQSQTGAAGGVMFVPRLTPEAIRSLAEEFCQLARTPERILPGGFLHLTDLVFSPGLAGRIGDAFATIFGEAQPDYVLTVETKGIPLALMTARALNRPMVVLRRDARVSEGSTVSINYVSGSTRRIQAMSLPRRALPPGARVLFIDDFMRAGGTARGMVELMAEVEAVVVGIGVLMATREPERKLVDNYHALVSVEKVDEERREAVLRPSDWLAQL